MNRSPSLLSFVLGASLTLDGCDDDRTCEEDVRAQVLSERVRLEIAGFSLDVEVARTPTQQDRGWKHRRCDQTGLLLIGEPGAPLPVWGCELAGPVDVIAITGGTVASVTRLDPCDARCTACPTVGMEQDVSAVLEIPAGTLDIAPGDDVQGLP